MVSDPFSNVRMVYARITLLIAFLLDLVLARVTGERDKDLEILILRHQLRLLQRNVERTPR